MASWQQDLQTTATRVDGIIYRAERQVIAGLFVLLSGAVFLDVVHRIFSRSPGRLASILAGLSGDTWSVDTLDRNVSPWLIGATFLLLVYAALRTRSPASRKARSLMMAVVVTAVLSALVQGFVALVPQGIVWAPYLALCCLLWIGLLGASMATSSGKHLALEMAQKLWPTKVWPWVRRAALLVTALFCCLLVVLGSLSVADYFASSQQSAQAGLIPAVDLPKWLVFVVIPYSFGMMALRCLGRMVGLLPDTTAEIA